MYEFKLPDVGEGIHEAEILAWLVKAGDVVKQDQPILEVQTDKAVVEIPAPVAGTVAEIRAPAGSLAQVGDVLVVIAPAGQKAAPDAGASNAKAQPPRPQQGPAPGMNSQQPGGRVLAAPAVRKLALELGVDLSRVTGSGPAGRVLPSDVREFMEQQTARPAPSPPPETKPPVAAPVEETGAAGEPPQPSPPALPGAAQELIEREPLQGLRRRIAERMEQAWRAPHVTSFEEVEVSKLAALRQDLKVEAEGRGVRLTYLPLIIKATIQALKEFPYFNATLDLEKQEILVRRYYHIGLATAIPEGLVVPVVRHADRLSLLQIAAELNRLAELARQRRLSLEELSGGTFTITNFGSFGGQQGTPIINPPEVAILGCGRIEDKPVAIKGQVEVRPMLPLALSFDHRLIDGAAAAQFLGRLKALLADPNLLFLEM